MRFIGDVHGKYRPYKRIIKGVTQSIQVGDMGVGFHKVRPPFPDPFLDGVTYDTNPPHYAMTKEGESHRFIRGNHDNPEVCKRQSQWIPDGHVEGDMMFIGGAVSVDQEFRTEGVDWWRDEELSIKELDDLITKVADIKPRVMVTHEAPEFLVDGLIIASGRGYKLDWPSRTRQAFEAMYSLHKPELWIFGHWHVSFDYMEEGCRFKCLNELEYFDI